MDGCKGGWFLVAWDGAATPDFALLPAIRDLSPRLPAVEQVLIDIPIGLRSSGPDERSCDRLARKRLGRRGASVFPAPARTVLACTDHAGANALSRATTGRGLSCQSWNIVPKIAEVDGFLQGEPQANKVHEMHPELCFWALNGGSPMQHNKKTEAGHAERLALLARHCAYAAQLRDAALQAYPRRLLARDDILDALVGAVVAAQPGELERLPPEPEHDACGLPMEIVYKRVTS